MAVTHSEEAQALLQRLSHAFDEAWEVLQDDGFAGASDYIVGEPLSSYPLFVRADNIQWDGEVAQMSLLSWDEVDEGEQIFWEDGFEPANAPGDLTAVKERMLISVEQQLLGLE